MDDPANDPREVKDCGSGDVRCSVLGVPGTAAGTPAGLNGDEAVETGREGTLPAGANEVRTGNGHPGEGSDAAGGGEEQWTVDGMFIMTLNPADGLTLVALAMNFVSLSLVAAGRLYLGMAVLLIGMLFDAFDGIIARKYGWESPFGRFLDGFVDVFNYLVTPVIILWVAGLGSLTGPVAALQGLVMFIFVALGLVRLSVFNMIGNIKVCGGLSYLGLPVFWSHFILAPLVLLRSRLPLSIWVPVCDVSFLVLAFCFILNRPFWKPKNIGLIVGVILSLAACFVYLGV